MLSNNDNMTFFSQYIDLNGFNSLINQLYLISFNQRDWRHVALSCAHKIVDCC